VLVLVLDFSSWRIMKFFLKLEFEQWKVRKWLWHSASRIWLLRDATDGAAALQLVHAVPPELAVSKHRDPRETTWLCVSKIKKGLNAVHVPHKAGG